MWLRFGLSQPATAQRCRSETDKFILEDLFSSAFSKYKKYQPSRNLKFHILGIFQSLKLRNLMGKILQIYLRANFTPNTLGCCGLRERKKRKKCFIKDFTST